MVGFCTPVPEIARYARCLTSPGDPMHKSLSLFPLLLTAALVACDGGTDDSGVDDTAVEADADTDADSDSDSDADSDTSSDVETTPKRDVTKFMNAKKASLRDFDAFKGADDEENETAAKMREMLKLREALGMDGRLRG